MKLPVRGMVADSGSEQGRLMRILIAEAVEQVRNRLVDLVLEQSGSDLIGVEHTLARFIHKSRLQKPDLILLGTRLEDATSFEALEQLMECCPDTRVILFCDQVNGQYLFHAKSLGVEYVLELARDIELLPSLLRQLTRSFRKTEKMKRSTGEEVAYAGRQV